MNSLNKVQSHLLAECFNKLFIGGQFVYAIDGEKIPTYYPATGEFLHEFPRGKANNVVSVALVGMRNEQEMKQNVEAAELELTETDLKEINTIFKEENCPTYFDYPMDLNDG